MTGLLYSEVEEDLRASLRAILADRAPWQRVLARTEYGRTTDAALWRALAADLGVAGLAVPEDLGGAGASWREAAVAAEELGAAVAPVPWLGSCMATAALLSAGEDRELVRAVASGESTAVLAVPLAAPDRPSVTVSGDRLSGRVEGVADALTAGTLLVAAGGGLFAVEAAQVSVTPVVSLDMTRQLADLELAGVRGRRVGGRDALRAGVRAGAALLACEQLGIAARCLEMTVEYVKTRHQFGRPVGSYQGLKHRLADLWVGVTQARAVARYAAGCLADDDADTPVAVAVAQAHCGPVAVRAAEECVQMHGGIGFTWEHPAHLYLKRAKADSVALGTAARHRADLASLVNLPG
jgi:alkylation response protein AidB-like acyl-CoA dehydrogenase